MAKAPQCNALTLTTHHKAPLRQQSVDAVGSLCYILQSENDAIQLDWLSRWVATVRLAGRIPGYAAAPARTFKRGERPSAQSNSR